MDSVISYRTANPKILNWKCKNVSSLIISNYYWTIILVNNCNLNCYQISIFINFKCNHWKCSTLRWTRIISGRTNLRNNIFKIRFSHEINVSVIRWRCELKRSCILICIFNIIPWFCISFIISIMSKSKISKASFFRIKTICCHNKCSRSICRDSWINSKRNLSNHISCPSRIIVVPWLIIIFFNSPWISHQNHIKCVILLINHLEWT